MEGPPRESLSLVAFQGFDKYAGGMAANHLRMAEEADGRICEDETNTSHPENFGKSARRRPDIGTFFSVSGLSETIIARDGAPAATVSGFGGASVTPADRARASTTG